MRRSHVDRSGGDFGLGPGHQVVDAGVRPTVDELRQGIGQPGVRIDAVEFAGLDHRGDDRPVGAALVATGEERTLALECDRVDGALDGVAVDFNATVVEDAEQPFPVTRSIPHGLSERPETDANCLSSQALSSLTSGLVRACRCDRRWPSDWARISASIPYNC